MTEKEGRECIELLRLIEESQDTEIRRVGEEFYFLISAYCTKTDQRDTKENDLNGLWKEIVIYKKWLENIFKVRWLNLDVLLTRNDYLAIKYYRAIKDWQEMKENGRSDQDLSKANWKIGQIKRLLQKKAVH